MAKRAPFLEILRDKDAGCAARWVQLTLFQNPSQKWRHDPGGNIFFFDTENQNCGNICSFSGFTPHTGKWMGKKGGAMLDCTMRGTCHTTSSWSVMYSYLSLSEVIFFIIYNTTWRTIYVAPHPPLHPPACVACMLGNTTLSKAPRPPRSPHPAPPPPSHAHSWRGQNLRRTPHPH